MKDSVFQKRYERRLQNHQVYGQQLTVFNLDLAPHYPISSLVVGLMELCEGQVSKGLLRQMTNCTQGFDESLQLLMAECLKDCVDGKGLHTTGIKNIDQILWPLYRQIQRELANRSNNGK